LSHEGGSAIASSIHTPHLPIAAYIASYDEQGENKKSGINTADSSVEDTTSGQVLSGTVLSEERVSQADSE